EKPEIMGQFVGAIQGIGAACTALDMPIVSGNVSLYNETDGQPILPTPTIGAVGLIEDVEDLIRSEPRDGHVLMLLGPAGTHLGRSALLAEVFNRTDGDAPPVDLDAERRAGAFILDQRDWISSVADISDGGLILAAFELAEAASLGLTLEPADTAAYFGEDQGRYLIATSFDKAEALMVAAGQAGLALSTVGQFGGTTFLAGTSEAETSELSALYRSAFETALDL
ncbi:MAG: AIR synthase-related protein, partial [Pseudomonadota bacterium]